MRIHEIKSWPRPFTAVTEGEKRADFRRDDRDYNEHDLVILREWIPLPEHERGGSYTGAALVCLLTHIESAAAPWGIPAGYVVLSLLPIARYGVDDEGWRMVVEGDDRQVLPLALRRSAFDDEARDEIAQLREAALEDPS